MRCGTVTSVVIAALMRSGAYFRQLLRPGLSHTYFQRALPLLQEYAAANRHDLDLPPGFRERLDACPLSPRDLLHLDYAICLGYVEIEGLDLAALSAKPARYAVAWARIGKRRVYRCRCASNLRSRYV